MRDERSLRVFLAVEPPAEILRDIASIQDRLRKLIGGDIGWVRPGGIHLTLKFFGDVSSDQVANIMTVVERATERERPFPLAVGGVGLFPDVRRPRVLWLGLSGDVERLQVFQSGLETAFFQIGFSREERPFRPHLTLGRIRNVKGLSGLSRALDKGEAFTAGRFFASEVHLIKSELTPGGAVYTKLKEFSFAGKDGALVGSP